MGPGWATAPERGVPRVSAVTAQGLHPPHLELRPKLSPPVGPEAHSTPWGRGVATGKLPQAHPATFQLTVLCAS